MYFITCRPKIVVGVGGGVGVKDVAEVGKPLARKLKERIMGVKNYANTCKIKKVNTLNMN